MHNRLLIVSVGPFSKRRKRHPNLGPSAAKSSLLQSSDQLEPSWKQYYYGAVSGRQHDSTHSGLFQCGGSLGHIAVFIESNGDFKETQDTNHQRSRCDYWNIGSFSSYLPFCSVGKVGNHSLQSQRRINSNNATFVPQELDGDGKSDEAVLVINDQPTEQCPFLNQERNGLDRTLWMVNGNHLPRKKL